MRKCNQIEIVEGLVDQYRELVIDDPGRISRKEFHIVGIINNALNGIDLSQIRDEETTLTARLGIIYGGYSSKRGITWLPDRYAFVLAKNPDGEDSGRPYVLKALITKQQKTTTQTTKPNTQ
ncbi:MAG: hypothetical protein ABIB47_01540 [Candidatus Woesearchaeota archaeon]